MSLDKSNKKEENISINVSELLSQREDDLKAFEQQKEYMTNFINMLGKIEDVIDGKERTLGKLFSNFLLPRTPRYDEPLELLFLFTKLYTDLFLFLTITI